LIKNIVPASLLAFTLPVTTFALGLGEMKVKSYLDQPFYAEISLIDVGGTPLALVKPDFASVETYEQMGLTKSLVESNLQIALAKGENGKPVIQITSKEHITDPFMDLVIDLVWPQGQSYKEYTVLLDPPNYALQEKGTRSFVKRPKYNKIASQDSPPRVHPVENTMEVQKAYARDSVDNAAPKARNFMPPTQESTVSELPSTLIPIASNQQTAPLVDNVPPIPFMQVAGKPVSVQLAAREPVSGVGNWSSSNTELSVASAAVESLRESNLVLKEQFQSLQVQNKKLQSQLDARDKELMQLRSQLDILIKAGPSVGAQVHSGTSHGSDGNGLFWFLFILATGGAGFLFWYLKKQQPEQLQAFVAKSTDYVKRTVPQLVPKSKETTQEETPVVTPDVVETPIESVNPVKESILNENTPAEEPVQVVSQHPEEAVEEEPTEETLPEVEVFHKDDSNIELTENLSEDVVEASSEEPLKFSFEEKEADVKPKEENHKETPLFTMTEPSIEPIEENPIVENKLTIEPSTPLTIEPPLFETHEPVPDDNIVEFESGLYTPQEKTKEAPEPIELSDELARSLEVHEDLSELIENNPLKSEKALDTLIDLAKTYIGMGDKEAAKHSLDEVMEYGTAAQKAEAKAILDEMG
jgi:FimV-like protein